MTITEAFKSGSLVKRPLWTDFHPVENFFVTDSRTPALSLEDVIATDWLLPEFSHKEISFSQFICAWHQIEEEKNRPPLCRELADKLGLIGKENGFGPPQSRLKS